LNLSTELRRELVQAAITQNLRTPRTMRVNGEHQQLRACKYLKLYDLLFTELRGATCHQHEKQMPERFAVNLSMELLLSELDLNRLAVTNTSSHLLLGAKERHDLDAPALADITDDCLKQPASVGARARRVLRILRRCREVLRGAARPQRTSGRT
jgi:hypothetical protein